MKIRKVNRDGRQVQPESWHNEAWDFYSQVGELRYVANALAGRMAAAEIYVELDGERLDEPDPVLDLITPQMIRRFGINLFIAGTGYLVGVPDQDNPQDTNWMCCSTKEVKFSPGHVEVLEQRYKIEDIYIDRIWDPHPSNFIESDSPTRSALPVLRELVGLTQHVNAQIDSRLAGAGIYWIPDSILQGGTSPTEVAETDYSDNAILNAIVQGMLTPIEDRAAASAIVPLLLGAPDESISKIRFDSFATPFDENTSKLREEAIRRLALNLDAPPELLLGMGASNHWSAWLVRDEVVQVHVAPRLQLICNGLEYFYRAIKEQQGDPRAQDYELKADVGQLVQRPNRLADASSLHTAGVLSDEALREAGGFEETDSPSSEERAIKLAIGVAQGNAQLVDNLAELYGYFKNLLDGTPETGPPEPRVIQRVRTPGGQPAQPPPAPQAITEADAPPAQGEPPA